MTPILRSKLREISALCRDVNSLDTDRRKTCDAKFRGVQHMARVVLAIVRRKERTR